MPGMAATWRHLTARRLNPDPREGAPGSAAVPAQAVFTADEMAIGMKCQKGTLNKLAREGLDP